MTINPKPGDQPDTDDMATPFNKDGEAGDAAANQPNLDEEEEAAKLGDFA